MSKFTPGPWHLFDELTICAKDNGSVAFAYGPSFPARSPIGREAMANAHLIAAAPDLLRELKAARSELWRLLDAKGISPEEARNWPEIVSADAAILKATGEGA